MLKKTRSRSKTTRSKGKTADEKKYLGAISNLPCCICGSRPVEVHHIRTHKGFGVRASHFETLSLCTEHHRGKTGLHGMGRKAFERFHGVTELELLEKVSKLLK